jgi:FlaA1/EpsC-like NDP-sugar epimerase
MKNVLIIGAGGIGRRHIKGYLSTNRVSLSIVEPDDKKIRTINSSSCKKKHESFYRKKQKKKTFSL